MKKKALGVLLTASMMASLLAGCGSSETVSTDTADGAGETAEGTETAGEETTEWDEEPTEIVVALMCLSPIDSSASDHVEEALNEMLLEKINVQADIQWFDATTYASQVPMMIQAGEQLDLMMFTPVPGGSYQSFMSQNQLVDISDSVDEYGSDIKAVMGDYLESTTKDGALYGVGNMTSLYASYSIGMRTDVLDELGLTETAQNMTTWTEYKDILTQVTENTDLVGVINADAEGSVISSQPFMAGGDSFSETKWVDVLGDSYQYVYADEDTDTVQCYFYSDDWYNNIVMAKDFYDAGLIYKDASTTQDYADTLIKNNVGFSLVKQTEEGAAASLSSATGYDCTVVDVTQAKVATGAFQKFGFAVPVTAKEEEAAIKFLNLLYGDKEVVDTLTWGVEGVDFVRNEDGTLSYPEGVTADTVQYHTGDFLYGNRLLISPWEGNDPDIRETQAEENESMEKSKYFGFSVDSTPVSNEITACKNIIDQYKPQLSAGIVDDVDATYNEFKSALEAAGMQTILDEYQSQLDAWLAEQ